MRQAGILAAAGRHALQHHVARLADDHAHARALAAAVAGAPHVTVDTSSVETNIVMIDVTPRAPISAEELVKRAQERGVLLATMGSHRVRAVTHLDVDREACVRAAEILTEILRAA
jgi:threonine aldolase